MNDRTIVSVCGPSGAGKSQLAKALTSSFGEDACARVPADYFIMPVVGPLDESLNLPIVYDWATMYRTVARPLGEVVSTPRFDFSTFKRSYDGDTRSFVVRPLLIIDAMYPYPCADFVVQLELDASERRQRIIDRDGEWSTRVLDRWEQLVASEAQLRKSEVTPDLILSGGAPIAENVRHVSRAVTAIRRRRQDQ